MQNMRRKIQKLNTAQIIALGFAGVIFVGAIILWLPFCTAPGQTTSFTDAMFTATTSVCVTGLSTVTMSEHWTLIGKLVILALIQIGGIGVIAIGTLIFIAFRRRLSMKNLKMIRESYNVDGQIGMSKLVVRIVKDVFLAEGIGAVLYLFCFIPRFGVGKGICQACFTAISAFCNAGIDMLGADSLIAYRDDVLMNLITIGLIIVSGLGFIVWWDIGGMFKKVLRREMTWKRAHRGLRFHTKLVLDMTLILVVGGTILVFIFEFNNADTLKALPFGNKLLASAFQSVTTRTAGFMTVPQELLSQASVVLCLFLMFIGGSPMGTAGGVKTTTIGVLVLALIANIRGKKDVELHHRKIRNTYVQSALVVTVIGFLTVFIMSMALAVAMPNLSLADVLYEITSAAATVGLSRGVTGTLNMAGKWIVISTMYLGRIGPITMGSAVVIAAAKTGSKTSLVAEDMMIG